MTIDVPPLAAGNAQLWLFRLEATLPQLDGLLGLLDEEEASRAARFQLEHDRTAFVVSHAMLRTLLGAILGRAPAEVPFARKEGGKPFVPYVSGLEFSLSHSGDTGLIGIATAEIGVDVETVRHLRDRDLIAERFFAPGEIRALERLPERERQDAFFSCWARKEAYVKALGVGLAAPLDTFEVSVQPDAAPALLAIEGSADRAAAWSTWTGRPSEALHAAAAVRRARVAFTTFRADAEASGDHAVLCR